MDSLSSVDAQPEQLHNILSDPLDASASTTNYYLKEIVFPDAHLQRINIATICNTLALRGDIVLPLRETVTFGYLTKVIGSYLLEQFESNLQKNPSSTAPSPDTIENTSQKRASTELAFNFDETLALIPTLITGLDINLKFDSVYSFEKTRELVLFDVFNVKLVHGWTCDPQDTLTYTVVVSECGSYNGLINIMVQSDVANTQQPDRLSTEELQSKTLIAQEFLKSTPSQLTYHGLCTLSTSLPDSLYVLFRNNHFHTLYKRGNGKLYTLVTDLGYRERDNIVWETLDTVDGDSQFLNCQWQPFDTEQRDDFSTSINITQDSPNEDRDLAFAIQLQEEENQAASTRSRNPSPLLYDTNVETPHSLITSTSQPFNSTNTQRNHTPSTSIHSSSRQQQPSKPKETKPNNNCMLM